MVFIRKLLYFMQGCYVSIDDFKNKFMVISKKLGHHEPVRHVLNECWFA